MTFDGLYDSLTSDGWLSKLEAALLVASAASTAGPILEVGSYCGRSSVLLYREGNSALKAARAEMNHQDFLCYVADKMRAMS